MEMVKRRVQTRMERKRTGPQEWVVVIRWLLADNHMVAPRPSRDATDHDTRPHYQYSLSPPSGSEVERTEPSLSALARVSKTRACIEASFKRGQSAVGMDASQVRTWQSWHHHMALRCWRWGFGSAKPTGVTH